MQVYKVIKPSQQIGNFEIMSINSCTCCYCQTAHNASVFANGKQLVPILAKSMCVYVGQKITLGQGFLTRAVAIYGTYSSPAMRSGFLSQTASGSQLHAIEAMRTQTIDQQCMQSQVEQDETLSAGNRLPNACIKVYVLFILLHAYQFYTRYPSKPCVN